MSGSETADGEPACETCGEPVADSDARRVLTRIRDGAVQHRHFCSDACFEARTS